MVTPHQPSEPWPSEALESGALLAGPGIGINPQSQEALGRLISGYSGPLVIDADAFAHHRPESRVAHLPPSENNPYAPPG
jgi:NAD(P)H-hydrate repair Nnr-like enzyme with NAD(P)H-hydrate dehydratase domain